MQTSFFTKYSWYHVEFSLNLCIVLFKFANFSLISTVEHFQKNRPWIPKNCFSFHHCCVLKINKQMFWFFTFILQNRTRTKPEPVSENRNRTQRTRVLLGSNRVRQSLWFFIENFPCQNQCKKFLPLKRWKPLRPNLAKPSLNVWSVSISTVLESTFFSISLTKAGLSLWPPRVPSNIKI